MINKTLAEPDFSISGVAMLLQVSAPTVYKMIHHGKLAVYKVGRCTRVTRESVERLRNGGDA